MLAVFVPEELSSWKDKDNKVTFYPFLVIIETRRGRSCWLPYWHVVEGKRKTLRKYGQWAPFLHESEFASLLTQARNAGYKLWRA